MRSFVILHHTGKVFVKALAPGTEFEMLDILASALIALVFDIEMPLAANARDIAGRLQTLGQRDDFAAHRDAVVLHPDFALILAGKQSPRDGVHCGAVT